jgi:hypothetical protein
MFSQTLWYAFAIYLIGVGIVLYLRPTLMFGPGGVWREFGLSNDELCTLFPFWLFAIVWAVMSYALASMIMIVVAGMTIQDEIPGFNGLEITSEPDQISPISNSNNFKAPKINEYKVNNSNRTNGTNGTNGSNMNNKAGYYVLNTSKNEPSYVYIGKEPPSEDLVEAIVNARL